MFRNFYDFITLIFFVFVLVIIGKISFTPTYKTPLPLLYAKRIPVKITGKPKVSAESIDIAMKAYSIYLPNNTVNPSVDKAMVDRGLTLPGNVFFSTKVFIGPEAFMSWGLLGSTLAHEVEIHCRQNVYLIVLKDILGLEGTLWAEREAYSYEISNKNRFHLTSSEIEDIKIIRDQFYPVPEMETANK